MMSTTLGYADIGLLSFHASSLPADTCGHNGLPVTPNSIKILGRFQQLKTMTHNNLCQYIDIVRGKHERLVVVSEHLKKSLFSLIQNQQLNSVCTIEALAYQIMRGLDTIHQNGLVHRCLSLDSILFTRDNRVKLSKYGLYHMTGYSNDVMFPICNILYMAPEILISGVHYNTNYGPSKPSVDVWSLGMILLDCFLEGKLWGTIRNNNENILNVLLSFIKSDGDVEIVELLLKISGCTEMYKDINSSFYTFLKSCLKVNPDSRPSVRELCMYDFVRNLHDPNIPYQNPNSFFPAVYRSEYLQLPDFNKLLLDYNNADKEEDHLTIRPINEVYHIWGLAGGDVFSELRKHGLIKTSAPVLSLPSTILNSGEEFGINDSESLCFDQTTVSISLDQLRHRLRHIDLIACYPLVVEDDLYPVDLSETASLPLVIREKDVEYQYHRIILFERLLLGYPYTRDRIMKEARIDIPPYVRPKVWAALLNVTGDIFRHYDEIDKVSLTMTDRQIEVDIPRCHQYNSLLSSPTGHEKLKSVLKAWVVDNPKLVYWQGLDSLCAPFVTLNFNNEALALACVEAFIPKYLYNFFLKDNSQVIHEYLAVFKQAIAFHEPDLFNHLDEIGFQPELYAIPWFLTMFSHVFPLHKIYHLWDTLLLGNSMLPLCVGVAILQQFREQLLSFGFNDCILLFSDMPGIDIERCVKDSIKLFNHTPPSACLRKQDNPDNRIKPPLEEQFMNIPEKEFLSLDDLRAETCVRISPRDLVRISQLIRQSDLYPISSKDKNSSKDSKKKSKTDKKKITDPPTKILVVDIRPPEEFSVGHLAHSVNIPYKQFFEIQDWSTSPLVNVLEMHKGRMIMILGNKGPDPMQFGYILVTKGYRRVCVMDGSASILKSLGYMNATE